MRRFFHISFAMILLMAFAINLEAQESEAGHSHEKAERHGGTVTMTSAHHFEVVPMMHGIAVFAYDEHQSPVSVKEVTGTATVMLRSGKSMKFDLKPYQSMGNSGMMGMQGGMHGNSGNNGSSFYAMNSMMWGNLDLSSLDATNAKISVDLSGLKSSKESSVDFRDTINLTNLPANMRQAMQIAEHREHNHTGDMHSNSSD